MRSGGKRENEDILRPKRSILESGGGDSPSKENERSPNEKIQEDIRMGL
jgi:hypothetical protein